MGRGNNQHLLMCFVRVQYGQGEKGGLALMTIYVSCEE